MHLRRLLALMMCLSPLPAIAQDNADLCEALYRRLGNAPQVIGNSANVRAHAQNLTQQNIEIRKLRLDMRRHDCGSVSITMLGGPNDEGCRALRQMLDGMEQNRQNILSARNQARGLVISTHESNLIRADIEANNCAPYNPEVVPVAVDPQGQPDRSANSATIQPATPKQSSIIEFHGQPLAPRQQAPQLPPPPERDYDPTKTVRMVGPTFLPDTTDIDLANPASGGTQSQQ